MIPNLRTSLTVAFLGAAYPAVHGCTPVEGGAVESSWDLRTIEGRDVTCAGAAVGSIRLWWQVGRDDGTATRRFDAFACDDARGVTRFDLPPGRAELWLEPVCADGTLPAEGTYRAPPPIVRTITEGEVITLETQIIEVRATGCTGEAPCTCR
jgi:hypothetical protein